MDFLPFWAETSANFVGIVLIKQKNGRDEFAKEKLNGAYQHDIDM